MKSIGISEFKAKCISILKDCQATNQGLTVTHRGKPLVRIEPIGVKARTLGGLQELGTIKETLVGFDFDSEWEMNED
jgi:antitoxin (DNA-binding transcriptional repressor) of toxin-antitoxin stability system